MATSVATLQVPVKKKLSKGHDHTLQLKRVARIKGQVEGVERMILEGRYCPDILQQVKAARSALKALELAIYEGHLRGCVKKAIAAKNERESEAKIEELIMLMRSQG